MEPRLKRFYRESLRHDSYVHRFQQIADYDCGNCKLRSSYCATWTETASKRETPKDFVLNERSPGRRPRHSPGCERCSLREFTVILWELWTSQRHLKSIMILRTTQSITTRHKLAAENRIYSCIQQVTARDISI